MNIITIRTRPAPNADETDIVLNVKQIDFAYKKPLQDWLISLPGAIFNVAQLETDKFVSYGLIEFDTPENTTAYVNTERLIGYFTPQLGVYVFVFSGSRVGVQATEEEIKRKLGITNLQF